ncbi:MAG: hypothetical protein ACWGHO_03335 [Candidatus Moraniibacteriota bacterium]
MKKAFVQEIISRKKQILWIITIVIGFYIFSAWNLGGIISFVAIYKYSFNFLKDNLGLNEWLARGFLIPIVAIIVWSIKQMMSLTSKDSREKGTVLLILMLSFISFAIYFHVKNPKDHTGNIRLFNGITGKSNFNYYQGADGMDLFPIRVKKHPSLGYSLSELTPEVLKNLKQQENFKKEKSFLAQSGSWTNTGYYVFRGDILRFESDHEFLIMIGEKGELKIIPSGKKEFFTDSDGILFLILEPYCSNEEVTISGLSIRIYN